MLDEFKYDCQCYSYYPKYFFMKKVSIFLLVGLVFGISAFATWTTSPAMKDSWKIRNSFLTERPQQMDEVSTPLMRAMPGVKTSQAGRFLAPVGTTPMSSPVKMLKSKGSRGVSEELTLRGNIVSQVGWGSNGKPGIYTIPANEGESLSLCFEADLNGGGYDNNEGIYKGVSYFSLFGRYYVYVYTYNSKTGESLGYKSGAEITIACADCAMDPTTGKVYGCYFNSYGTGYVWAEGDYDAGKSTKIADIATSSKMFIAVGCDKNGQYYGISKDAILYKIEKTTGELTEIAQTELPVQYIAGGCINDANNTFLATFCTDQQSGLCEINLTTGETTLLTEFDPRSDVIGLHVYTPAAKEQAPDVPELEVACTEGAMAVDYTVTMPDHLFDGTSAEGETFTWKITAGSEEVVSGSLAAGATESGTAPVSVSGNIEFTLTCANAIGESPKARATCYIGKGVPAAPKGVSLEYDEARSVGVLSWEAVETASDEGFFNPAEVTYTVYDAYDKIISEGQAETQFEVAIDAPEEYTIYRYKVEAHHGGKTSAGTWSNKIGLGSYALPHAHAFDTPESIYEYIILDANNDGSTWGYTEIAATGPCAYYIYSDNEGDDWMFSPAFRMEAGKMYEVTAMVGSFSTFMGIEAIEIKAGKAASPEAMTMEVVPKTDLEWQTLEPLSGWVCPTETGTYTIGFHAVSQPDMWMMKMNSYEVSGPRSELTPDSISNLQIVPAADGSLSAELKFVAPSKSVVGSDLSGKVSISIKRNDEIVGTLSANPGENCTFTDNVPVKGEYVYTVTTFGSDDTEGRYATEVAYIGPNAPVNPTNVLLFENGNQGEITVAWIGVEKDVFGNSIAPEYLSYNVWTFDEEAADWTKVTDEPVSDQSFTFDALSAPYDQKFIQVKVTALNRDEENPEGATAIVTAIGTPYELPVVLSADEQMFDNYLFTASNSATSEVGVGTEEVIGVPAYDGDDAYFVIVSNKYDDSASFSTGKIDLGDAPHPVVSFRTFKVNDLDENIIRVGVLCDGEFEYVLETAREDLPGDAWSKVKVNLDKYAGKCVQLSFGAVVKSYSVTMFDAIRVETDVLHDVVAYGITAPAVVETAEKFNVEVELLNDGALDATNFSVDLYKNGAVAETKEVALLKPAAKSIVSFECVLQPTDGKEVAYYAVVRYTDDVDAENNISPEVVVARSSAAFPVVSGLVGSQTASGVALEWDAIDLSSLPADAETTDFEDGKSWADEYEGWTFVDLDGGEIGGIQGSEIPEHPAKSKASFWVFDASDTDAWNKTFTAHSGSKYLASMFNFDDSQVDDWAISPELDGNAQIVEFYAHSYSELYLEEIEVWYSTANSTDPSEFVKLESFGRVTVQSRRNDDMTPAWTQMKAFLPDGAKRFAVRTNATGAFMLMLDDFSFAKAGGPSTLEFLGYNVYRDGVKLNDAPVAENSFVDAEAANGSCTYYVSAVYNRGESEVSEPWTSTVTGIEGVDAGSIFIGTQGHEIIVTGAADAKVNVFNAQGQAVAASTGDLRVAVMPGVYVVTAGCETRKVIVK